MSGISPPVEPWGYLLPMRSDIPSFALHQNWAAVYLDQHEALVCDTDDRQSLIFRRNPNMRLFYVWFEADSDDAFICGDSSLVHLNGRPISGAFGLSLDHGDRISFGQTNNTYVFVNGKYSDSKLPVELQRNFLLGQYLGGGGFGRVYVLFDKTINYERRVLKIVIPHTEAQYQYAHREGRILNSLKHPCVIEIFWDIRSDMQQFLVLEYMPGGDLTQFVNDTRPLTEAQTKLIFFQMVLAVEYLHKNGVCHRDLKPGNVLLERRNPYTLIKVTDFGLAKVMDADSILTSFAGSRPYLAPEIIKEKPYTNAVDIWSIGVILFYSLTGALPFQSLGEALRDSHDVKYVPEKWKGVSGEAKTLVTSMLKIEPSDRLSAALVIKSGWLRDEEMRKKAHALPGLSVVSEHFQLV